MSERRSWLLLALALAATACGLRTLSLVIHAPAECAVPLADGGVGQEPECPLSRVRSVQTILVRVDGTELARDCRDAASICTFEDLRGFVFLARTEASDGIEVIVEGRDVPACGGDLVMRCDSFGDAVIDLTTPADIPIWCDCPRPVSAP